MPNRGSSYDISDYYNIHENYVSLSDMDKLIKKAGELDIKIIFDLVMLVLPLFFIILGYLTYRKKFKINREMCDKIIADLNGRGGLDLDKEQL